MIYDEANTCINFFFHEYRKLPTAKCNAVSETQETDRRKNIYWVMNVTDSE